MSKEEKGEKPDEVLGIVLPEDARARWADIDKPVPAYIPGTYSGLVSAPVSGLRGSNPDLIRQVLDRLLADLGFGTMETQVLTEIADDGTDTGTLVERIVWRVFDTTTHAKVSTTDNFEEVP
ncbi:MAG: hypothetical protein GWN58_67555 [Anaerolineae bacterium]|nr:hypothetical protein [Anaerolineae bacterium]